MLDGPAWSIGSIDDPRPPKAGAPVTPPPPARSLQKHSLTHILVAAGRRFVTELIPLDVSSIKCGAADEFGVAGAVKFRVKFLVKFLGLVKSAGLVVGYVDPGQRRKYRGLVRAVPPVSRTAGWQSRQHLRHRAHAPAQRGLCVWLR